MSISIPNMEDMVVSIIGGTWEVLVSGTHAESRPWCESMGDGSLKLGWLIMSAPKKGARISLKAYGVSRG